MAEKSRKGPAPTKTERKRADGKRETATEYTDSKGRKHVATRCDACKGRGCELCEGRGFTVRRITGTLGTADAVSEYDRRTNFGTF